MNTDTEINDADTGSIATRKKRTKVRKATRGYKYDWDALRVQFIEGIVKDNDDREFVNLKELALRSNVPYERVRERAAIESWYQNRQAYQLQLAKQRQAKRITELSKESLDFDSSNLKLAKMGVGIITARMGEIARDIQEQNKRRDEAIKLQAAGFQIDPQDLLSAIDSKELDMLARAAQAWQQVGQKALGTDVIKHEISGQVENIDIDVQVTSITAELGRDDPERLAAFLHAAQRAGLLDTEYVQISNQAPEILEAEVLETTKEDDSNE